MNNAPNMLIVDSKNSNRDIIKEIFKDEYSFIDADSGVNALEILESQHQWVTVIVTDISLPDMDGYELIKKICSEVTFDKIPIVVVTGVNDSEKETKVFESGASDMIVKPFTPVSIKQRIKNAVSAKKNETENLLSHTSSANNKTREFVGGTTEVSALIDTIPGGFGIFSINNGKIKNIYANSNLLLMFGGSKEYYRFMKDDISRVIHPDDIESILNTIGRIKKTRAPADLCVRAKVLNGCWIWINVKGQFIVSDHGEDLLYVMLVDVSREKQYEEVISYRATHDIVTGIYNRTAFLKNTYKLINDNTDKTYAIIVLNVQRFKVINYLFGTEHTDELLKNIAKMLRENMGKYGAYGKLESDSFAVCVESSYCDIETINAIINDSFAHYYLGCRVSLNMGIYISQKNDVSVSQMCDRANLAMQSIKENDDINYAFYDENFRHKLIVEQEITAEMHKALDNGQFVLFMQPVYSVSKNIPISAEALVRWIHPLKGIIPPGDFIPLFEKNGFIAKLDRYVWEEACKYQRRQLDLKHKWVPISVNISRMSFYNEKLADEIYEIIQKYRLTPKHIKIELTESAYTDNPTQLIEAVDKLRNYGFLILMDDFGSGYSSLNMLKDITVDILKIDMRFMSDFEKSIKAGNIITSVVQMAKSLALDIIAEGAETKSQITFLTNIGCDSIQGYYFSKPIPCNEFESLIRNSFGTGKSKNTDNHSYISQNTNASEVHESNDEKNNVIEECKVVEL